MTPVLAFDIETVPDTEGLRHVNGLPRDMSDADVAELAFQRRRPVSGRDFLPLHLHRVVANSCALRERDSFIVWSLGDPGRGGRRAATFLRRGREVHAAAGVVERRWLRSAGAALPCTGAWRASASLRDLGEDDRDFKWNNYISRYHLRHLDLMDLLSLYQPRRGSVEQIARLLGFPGKLGMDGSKVWDAFQRGDCLRSATIAKPMRPTRTWCTCVFNSCVAC
jgi:predicted PolB exonuclease-like 3'-5' exonuclease